ncbi:MAG: hypothetical protein K9I94_08435, partial [Bacteroidales bacterium]|nr:hypothetical protein [Bacteroidales bacterium]
MLYVPPAVGQVNSASGLQAFAFLWGFNKISGWYYTRQVVMIKHLLQAEQRSGWMPSLVCAISTHSASTYCQGINS